MKYVALDIGNVLCHVDFKKFLDDLSEVCIYESEYGLSMQINERPDTDD